MIVAVSTPEGLLLRPVPPDTPATAWPVEAAPVPATSTLTDLAAAGRTLTESSVVVVSLPAQWSDEDLTVATWNLVTLLMRPSAQYDTGELVYRVEVRPGESGASHYSASPASGGLHTDGSLLVRPPDFGILMCLSEADEGGETVLVPVDDVREALAARPDGAVELLQQSHPFATEDDPDGHVRQWAPVLAGAPGATRARYLRRYLLAGWAHAGNAPTGLTEALDAVDDIVADPSAQQAFALRRGEVLMWRNAAFLHGRRSFTERGRRRRLVRIYGEAEAGRPASLSGRAGTDPDVRQVLV